MKIAQDKYEDYTEQWKTKINSQSEQKKDSRRVVVAEEVEEILILLLRW